MPDRIPFADLPRGKRSYRFEGEGHGATVSFFITNNEHGTGPVLHRHPYEEVFIVQEGKATFTVEGEEIEAEAGQIVIVEAGAAHRFVNSGQGPLRQVTIHPAPRMAQEDLE